MSLTQKQIDERQSYIGGSDIGSIMGFNKFNSAIDVFNQKVDGITQEQNIQMHWGNVLEPVIRDEFNNLLKHYESLEVTEFNITQYHKKHAFLAANVDGLIYKKNQRKISFTNCSNKDIAGVLLTKPKAILEIKTVSSYYSRRFWGEENHDLDCLKHRIGADISNGLNGEYGEIPDSYYCQCAWYMMIYDLPVAYLAVYFGGDMPFKVYKIERDLEFEKYMLETAIDFWENNVLKGIPPAPQTLDDIIKIYPHGVPRSKIIATNEICEKSHELKSIKMQIKDAKTHEDELKSDLKIFMKDASILVDVAGNELNKWTRKKQDKFRQKLLKEKRPDIYAEFTTEGDYERFC